MKNESMVAIACITLIAMGIIADGARILAVETIAAKSHWNFLSAVLRALTDGGHEILVFTPFLDGDRENYTEVDISVKSSIKLSMELEDLRALFNQWNILSTIIKFNRNDCDRWHNDRQFTDIVSRGLQNNFDAIVVEPGIWDCLSYMAAETGLPLIHTLPMTTAHSVQYHSVGVITSPAAVPPAITDHAVPRTFGQRFWNAVSTMYDSALLAYLYRLFRTVDPKPYDSWPTTHPSLVFVNGHFTSTLSRPDPENIINVGGIHLKPVRPIPSDILEFIDDSPHGVILFTFGSTVAITLLPDGIQKAIIEALEKLPQRVLLKYEGEMVDKPKNFMTRKWFPQRDILKHPNVKLFISHGGISGLYEAVDGRVPVLGFPLFGDQHRNIGHLVEWGMAISMEIDSVTKESFLDNILELVNNEKYLKNAKKVSEVFRDRPMSPEESVTYWTEYVIRHKGAPHFKLQGVNLNWYQYFELDCIAIILVFLGTLLIVIKYLIKMSYICILKYLPICKMSKLE